MLFCSTRLVFLANSAGAAGATGAGAGAEA